MDQRSGLAQQIPTGLEKTFLHSKQTAAKHFARLETENGTDPPIAPRRRSKHLHRIDMTPTPGPPYEWDEDKRHHNIEMHGVDFTLVDRANWPAAAHRRSDRQGELRYSSYVPVDDRVYNVVWTPRDHSTRIISFRKANSRETARYDREKL